QLWKDNDVFLSRRINAAGPYLPDPALEIPSDFRQQVQDFARQIDVARLDTSIWTHDVDHTLEEHTVGFARVCPTELAEIAKRWFDGLPSRS
ncbi:hypothetical protein NL487_26590, partial [Klebsiella pneumoniae]|nr:hypothetical protein [Klebsiella pneumoniae]